MSCFVCVLAAIDPNLIELAVILLLFGLGAIGKALAQRQQNQQKRPPAGNMQRPAQPPPANAANEIEEFMRRAAAKPRSAAGAQPVRRPPTLRPPEKPVQAEVVTAAPVGGQINKQVETYLSTQEFSQRSTKLGGEVAQADKEIDQRLHQVFDHNVSKLELIPGEAATPPVAVGPVELTEQSLLDIPATFATGLTDLLADPDFVRQAIVLNEMLHRPEERW